jgi:hypothetical protein
MFKDKIGISGELRVSVLDGNGVLKEERIIPNLITTVGLGFIATRMDGTGSNVMSHMAVGTGTTAANAADTTLETESARVALDSSTPTAAVQVYVATFPAGTGTGALTEAGVLNAASVGLLLCRTVFSVINKGASDSMIITWTITVS